MWCFYAPVLLTFLYVCVCVCALWGGVLVFTPHTWRGDVAFALGNVEIPQSLALGAFVAIHSTREWWTGSSALPGRILFPSKCAFCWRLCSLSFPGAFSTEVRCHRAPRVIAVTVEQKLGWAAQVAQSCFHHRGNVFFGDVITPPPPTCCICSEYTQEERAQVFSPCFALMPVTSRGRSLLVVCLHCFFKGSVCTLTHSSLKEFHRYLHWNVVSGPLKCCIESNGLNISVTNLSMFFNLYFCMNTALLSMLELNGGQQRIVLLWKLLMPFLLLEQELKLNSLPLKTREKTMRASRSRPDPC